MLSIISYGAQICARLRARKMVDLSAYIPKTVTAPPFPAVQIANSFIERFGKLHSIDHLKLQKLVYFTYGWWLALAEGQLPISSAKPQVWKFGPVFQPIYNSFAQFGNSVIEQPQQVHPFGSADVVAKDGGLPSQFIDWIWGRYGGFRGTQLSDMTHQPGTPWYEIAKSHDFVVPRFCEMEDDQLRTYFHKLGVDEGFLQ